MKKPSPTDSAILDWIALYATEINGLESKPGTYCLELICRDGDAHCEIVRRTSKTEQRALRLCVRHAMTLMPKKRRKSK